MKSSVDTSLVWFFSRCSAGIPVCTTTGSLPTPFNIFLMGLAGNVCRTFKFILFIIILTSISWAQSNSMVDSLNTVTHQDKEENELMESNFPQVVGPMFLQLPHLDSLESHLVVQGEAETIVKSGSPKNSSNDVISTGTIYRSISISPFAGSDMTGGLRMQLQGQLSENMQISGILSDEQSPIQPEGNTRSLEEIDQIYINITHPQFQMNAGDITLEYKYGKYNNISKRLIGLKNDFNIDKWSGSIVYAGSKGHYRQKEFKGSEGKQGPYFLDSESGNRNIVVQAGTERIWLYGKRLTRGENHDYTIDYSTAEIFFTPKHLIHSDSDILVEYQYNDFQYAQNITGGAMSREFGERGSLTFSWLREKDQIKGASLNISDEDVDILKSAGDELATRSGVVVDSLGKYIYFGGEYYEYQPDDTIYGDRFNITFTNDNEKGQYRRLISPTGEIYYEYVSPDMRDHGDDLYSPVKYLVSPVETQLIEISGQYFLTENTELKLSTAFSDLDQNIFSSKDDDDNTGMAYALNVSNNAIQIADGMIIRLSLNSWQENERFQPLQRVRSAMFYQDWNIDPTFRGSKQFNEIEAGLNMDDLGNGSLSVSSYQYGEQTLKRFFTSFNGGIHTVPHMSVKVSEINGKTGFFRQRYGAFEFLPGYWHPFYDYQYEEQENVQRFDHHTVGVKYAKDKWQASLGMGERLDYLESDSTNNELEFLSEGIFGSFDLLARNVNGWTQEITIRRRIKNDKLANQNYNFTLGRIRTSFRKPRHPLRWDLRATIEETFTESRALVYDSIGVGLGDYRYDTDFDEYVKDPNGDFIAYTIFTGDRYPTTKLDGLQLLEFDFGQTNFSSIKDFSFRSEMRAMIEGSISSDYTIFNPELGDTSFSRSKWSLRNEVTYHPLRSNTMVKMWHRLLRNFDGLDNRGQDLRKEKELGIEFRKPIYKNLNSEIQVTVHDGQTESTVSELRERSSKGYWISGAAKWRYDQWLLEGAAQVGKDQGTHRDVDFSARAVGLRIDVLRFIGKKGRIHARLEWFNTGTDIYISSLPPEALNGLALGQTIRSNIQGQIMIGRGVSLNVTMNYISDQRYDQFITLNGEVRAYF